MSLQINTTSNQQIRVKTIGFSGGERHVELSDLPDQITGPITIQANILTSNDLMDLLLVENALQNQYSGQVSINLELPYLPYSRQDRVCSQGQAFSLEVITRLIQTMAIDQLVTWDCHSEVGVEMTNAKNISPTEIIQSNDELLTLLSAPDTVLICPDKGARSRCLQIKESLGIEEIIYCEKKRDPATGKINHTDVLADDLSNAVAVITDDICDGGYTFIKIAEQLHKKNVGKVILFVTHGIFSKGLDVFDGLIDHVFTTDSFPNQENKKLTVIKFSTNSGAKK